MKSSHSSSVLRRCSALLSALACAALTSASLPAAAQGQPPPMAIGEHLPDKTMPVGTVTVRVIPGSMAEAVIGAEVTLAVAGQAQTAQTAKTDGSGRATFRDLPVGATVVASIVDEQQQKKESSPFQIPAAGGSRVMLSTKPYTGEPASHTPGAGPRAQGAPEARAMSGQPRADQGMPPGSYQVRLMYNGAVAGAAAPESLPPAGEKITLVGYRSDDTVSVRAQQIDDAGRAVFSDLDVSGHTTYFAMARLPRGKGVDRLMAVPVQPDTQVGAKVILAGDRRDAETPPIDEIASPQSIPTPAGKVRVSLEGVPANTPVTLVDAATKTVLGTATPAPGAPDPRRVQGTAPFTEATDLPAGTVAVTVHGGPQGVDLGLPDVPVRVIPADQDNAEGVSAKTSADGTVQLSVPTDKPQKAVLNINGKDLVSAPFEVAKSGGRLEVAVRWEAQGRPEAMFDVPYRADLVVYAETRFAMQGRSEELYRSRPVQLLQDAGVHLPVTIYPRVLLHFENQSAIEDDVLHVRGSYTVENISWSPYKASADGMVIPLPEGFNARVDEEFQNVASVAPGEGVRVVRPLAPGRTSFVVNYYLKSEGGVLEWRMPVKQDLFQSSMQIRLHDGMEVKPRGTTGRVATSRDGRQWFLLDEISIRAGQMMEMKITGMPHEPSWRYWLPRLVGMLVLIMIVAGVVFALVRKPARAGEATAASADSKRRAQLLDELVELDRTGKDLVRREQLLAELERLWR